jgi:hypothetical protein
MSQEYVHFCLQPYALFLLATTLHIIYFLHLLSTNHKSTQTYCSEGEDELEFFDEEF